MGIMVLIDGGWDSRNDLTKQEIIEGINYDPENVDIRVDVECSTLGLSLYIDVTERWNGGCDLHNRLEVDIEYFSKRSKTREEWLDAVKRYLKNESDKMKKRGGRYECLLRVSYSVKR